VNGGGFDEVAFGTEGFAQAFPSPHEALIRDGGFWVAIILVCHEILLDIIF
jgi:hypothetical protein